jgi:ABC-type nitrate/sulfonate/bicarbonate transport system substrate-binding protein
MNNKITAWLVSVLIIILWAIYFTLNTGVDSPKKISENENVKVKIATLPIVQGLPIYLAIEKWYFIDEWIDVEMIKFQSPNQIVDALISWQVDLVSPSWAMWIIWISEHN